MNTQKSNNRVVLVLAALLAFAFGMVVLAGGPSAPKKDHPQGKWTVDTASSTLLDSQAQSTRGTPHGGGGSKGVITVSPTPGTFGGTAVATVNPGGSGTFVRTQCYQDGTLVFVNYEPVDENDQAVLVLGPSLNWPSGDATCVADEGYQTKNRKWRTLASTTFEVVDP